VESGKKSIGEPWENRLRMIIAYSVVLLGILAAFSIVALIIYRDIVDDSWYLIAKEHFAAVIGLPCAAVASFILIRAFEHQNEKIEFKILGAELNATSGAIVLWVVVFLSITLAIKTLW